MARKLNKVLVAAVASVAVLGGGAYFAAPTIINLMRPIGKTIAAGDAAAAAGDWETASVNYGKAASRAGNDIDLQIKYADAFDYTVAGDIDKLRQLRQTQASILANDPRSIPALRRVLAYQRTDVQRNPADNAAVRTLTGTAERLEKLVPGDREARLAMVTAVYEPYARNMETRAEDVETQRDAVDKLYEEKPDDAEALRLAVQFRLVAAQRAVQQGDTADAKEQFAQVLAFVDAAVAKTPQLPAAWVSRADTYRAAAYFQPGNEPAQREALAKEFAAALVKANELVKPDDTLFLAIRSASLRQLEIRNPKEAEAGYRKLLTELPDDRQPRLILAEFLARQPNRRDDAVAVLDAPFKPSKTLKGMESIDQRQVGLIERVRRTAIRLGALAAVTDPAERKSRIEVIEKEYRELSSDPDISTRFKPAVLRVQGGLELAQGKITEAITTLDSALKLMNPDSPSPVEQDMRNDTLMEYAQAQLRLNQSGQARPALAELVQRKPENLAARAMLADLLIRERSYEAADQQVKILERVAADSPIVQQMRLRMAAQQGSLKDRYAEMVETTRDKQFLKLQAAATLNDTAEVARLAKLMIAVNPADPEAVTALVQTSLAADRRDEAIAVVAAALQAEPGDARLKSLAESLAARTPEDRAKLVQERVENLTDPYTKALAQAEVARSQGRPADAIESYKAAQKIKPDDSRAFEAQFQVAVTSRRFADAESILADLARLNVDQAGGALRRVQLAAARATVETDPERRETMMKDAATQAQAAARDHGGLATASLLYAQVLQQAGDVSTAIDQYQQTLDKSPTNVDALVGIADCLLRTDRRAEARERLTAVKNFAPSDARVRELELSYELKFGDPLKAVETLTAQAEQNPDNPLAAGRLGLALEQVAASREGDEGKPFTARAGEVYLKAFERFPQDLRFLTAYAEIQRRLGNAEVAEKAVEKAAADPAHKDQPQVAQLLADQYIRSNKYDDATRVLGELIGRTKPAPADAVQRLALIYARQNRLPEALATLDLRADDAAVQRQRVTLLLESGDLPGARAAVETALAAHPDADTYLLAAFVELRAGDLAKCEAFANQTLALRPSDAAALYYRAQVRMGRTPADLDGARDDLIKARDNSPRSADVRLVLADLYRRRGESDAAMTELQQAWQSDRTSKATLLRLVDAYARATPPAWLAVASVFEEARATPQLAGDPDVMLAEAETWAIRNDTSKAVARAKDALAVDAKNPQLRQRYFDLLIRAKAYRDLLSETSTDLQQTPDAWWLYRLRGIAFRRLDQTADAQKALDAAFNLAGATADPSAIASVARTIAELIDPKAALAKIEPYADPTLQVLAGEFAHASGDRTGSTARLEPLMAEKEKLPPPVRRRALQTLGMNYLQSVPPAAAKARKVFEELLVETPDDITLLNNLACVLLLPDSGGTPADALKPAQRAYDLVNAIDAPQLGPVVQDTYGWTLVKNNRAAEGVDLLRRASETATFPDVFLHLAEAYLASGNLEGAESALGDARSKIDDAARAKRPIDPGMSERLTQLSDELAKKRPTPGA